MTAEWVAEATARARGLRGSTRGARPPRLRVAVVVVAMAATLGMSTLAAGCGDDDPPARNPPSQVTDDYGTDTTDDYGTDSTEGGGTDSTEGGGTDSTEDEGADTSGDSRVIDATGENLEYPFYECADVDGDGIPDGPWDCDDNGIPDEDEDGGFLP